MRAPIPGFGSRDFLTCLVLSAAPLSLISGVTTIYVTLPAIESGFGVPGLSGLLLSGYLFCFLVALPVAGHGSDRLGGRPVFMVGMLGFAACSVAGSLAPSALTLCLFRAAAGACAAFSQAGAGAAIAQAFPHNIRGRAYGAWSFLGGIAGIISPLIAGFLLEAWDWRILFALPAVFALLGAIGAWLWLHGQGATQHVPFDYPGLAVFALAVASLVVGLRYRPILLAVAAGAAAMLVRIEKSRASPLIDVRLVLDRQFARAISLDLLISVNIGATLLLLPFVVEWQLGQGPEVSGTALALVLGLSTVLAVPTGALIDRWGPRWPTTVGCLALVLGYGGLAYCGHMLSMGGLLALCSLIGAGIGIEGTATVKLCLERMRPDRVGQATAMLWMARRCGDIIGVSVAGSLLERSAANQGQGFLYAFIAAAALAALALLLALLLRARGVPDQADGRSSAR